MFNDHMFTQQATAVASPSSIPKLQVWTETAQICFFTEEL